MKIISFLGLSSYAVTEYEHPEKTQIHETKYYQEALAQFYNPEDFYIFLTKKVENLCPTRRDGTKESQSNWKQIKESFETKFPEVNLVPVKNIPERNTPEDIWTIFNKVNDCLDEGDEVIFDITHSFRSVPIVALLAVSYFRVARKIIIKGLLYGAFEAKEDNITPSFDLLPVVGLFDWLTATDQFIKTGNGQDLAELLKKAGGNTEALGDRILEISQGLQLLRPMDVMTAAAALPQSIEQAKPDLSKAVPPFEMLLGRIVDEYGQFALTEPQNYKINGKESLQKQLFEIEWYAKKGLNVQALSLAREWLPSLLCHQLELNPMDKNIRYEAEQLCGGSKKVSPDLLIQYKAIEKKKTKAVKSLWFQLTELRNDVLHSGFRDNSETVHQIKGKLDIFIEKINEIALMWEIVR